MAIHRAAHLADPATRNHGPVLLVTYNRSLVTYLHHLAGDRIATATIETYGKFARGYLASLGLMPRWGGIAESWDRAGYVRQAVKEISGQCKLHSFFDRPNDFFLDELEWIDGHGIQELDQYLGIVMK